MSYVLPLQHVHHHRVVGELLLHLGWVPLTITEELSISSCITLCLCFAQAALFTVLVTFRAEKGVSQGWRLELDKKVTWNIEPWSLLAHRCWRLLVCLVLLLVLVWLADTRVLVVVKALWGKQVVWGRRVPLHHEYLALSYKCSDQGDRNSQCKCRHNLGNVPECHIQGSHLKRGQYNPVTEPLPPGVLSPSYFLLCRCTVGYTLYMSCLLAEPPTHRICEDWLDHIYHIIYLHTLQPCAFGRKIGLFRGWGKCFLSCTKHL